MITRTAGFERDPVCHNALTRMGLTPGQETLQRTTLGTARRRTFAQTAEILRLFVERWERTPGTWEWIEVDGERVMIGPWLAKARTKRNSGRLPQQHAQLLSQILQEDWTAPRGLGQG